MTILRFPAIVAVLVFAGALVLPTVLQAFTLTGWSLDLGQRDVRVFNNFSDPEANDNTVADPNFPGYLGADLAIWKAAVEWGSRLHGDGNGDPHQPGDLGSGGANFDFTWQGNTTAASTASFSNVVYELDACNPGVVAFTLSLPNGMGWRIGFCSRYTWHDGPGVNYPVGPDDFDLQGMATRQFGYALGLGNSSVPGATMHVVQTMADGGKSLRSIEADDIAGVQANYGAAAATKPVITGVTLGPAGVEVLGSQFAPTGNEVWFTQAGIGGDGTPVKATGVSSTAGGTRILVPLPAAAGSGDVLVKRSGGSHANLSNAWPLEVCSQPAPTNYCTAAVNSTGGAVVLTTSGSQSLGSDDLVFSGAGMPAAQFGLFVTSRTQDSVPIGNGILCVGTPFFRWNILQADGAGNWSWDPNLASPPDPAAALSAGQTWNFQMWYRDPAAGGAGFNFSDGVAVKFCM